MDAVNSSGWWTVITSPLDLTQYTLDNYRQAWTGEIAHSFVNSLAVTLPAIAIPILVAGFAAYAFAFMRFRGRDPLFSLVVGLLIVPAQVALAPQLRLYGDLGLTGTYAAVYLAHVGFNLPLAVFILRTAVIWPSRCWCSSCSSAISSAASPPGRSADETWRPSKGPDSTLQALVPCLTIWCMAQVSSTDTQRSLVATTNIVGRVSRLTMAPAFSGMPPTRLVGSVWPDSETTAATEGLSTPVGSRPRASEPSL